MSANLNLVQENNDFIVIDDGSKLVPIYNQSHEKVGEFRFVPTDINIVKRLEEVSDSFSDITKKLDNLDINTNGSSDDIDEMAIIKEVENELFDKVNYVLGGDFASAFFGKINPFTPVNGSFYCMNALNGLAKYINKQFNRETQAISNNLTRYTHGYRTGKHKNGGKKHYNGGKK